MYLEFADYKIYGGSRDDDFGAAFDVWEGDARHELDTRTMGRLRGLDSGETSEAVKRCMAKLIDLLAGMRNVSDFGAGHIASESNDGLSRSYKLPTADEAQAKIGEIINRYLRYEVDQHGVPLLYRGVHVL